MTGTTSRLVRYTGSIAAAGAILCGCSVSSGGQATAADGTSNAPSSETTTTAEGPSRARASKVKAPSQTAESGARPCRAADVEAAVSPGEYPTPAVFGSAIVIRNRGTSTCIVEGPSKLEIHTGGSGADLGVKVAASADDVPETVALAAGELASMSVEFTTSSETPVPSDCAEGGTYAYVTLPGDSDLVEAWFPNRADGFPPVCGGVMVGSWSTGGAPGVFGS